MSIQKEAKLCIPHKRKRGRRETLLHIKSLGNKSPIFIFETIVPSNHVLILSFPITTLSSKLVLILVDKANFKMEKERILHKVEHR